MFVRESSRTAIKIKFSDMRGEFGFLEAVAERKQYRQSGLRPENREIFSKPKSFFQLIKNPQIFDESVKNAI